MSTLSQITAFIDVVEEQSFVGAARKQRISTAAISRHISTLEAELKVQLLKRSTRHVSLTEIGVQYYQQVKKTLSELQEAELNITNSQKEATGTLRINTSRYFAMKYLIPRMGEFLQQNPQLKMNIEFAERHSDIVAESIDIIFGSTLEHPPHMVRKRIGDTHFILCAAKSYLKKYGSPITPQDLKQHRMMTHTGRNPDNQFTFKNHPPVFVDPILWLNDSHALCECAKNGLGIVKLHYYIAQQALRSGELIEILSEFNEAAKPVYLYYQQSRYLLPKIRRFVDFFND